MIRVAGIRFQQDGKMIWYDAGELEPAVGDYVVAETGRGMELGEVIVAVREVEEEQAAAGLPRIVRIATGKDIQQATDNRNREREAYQVCQRKIAEHKLEMKLVSVETMFDNSRMIFYFTANGRVDFRGLVKDLASTFRTRIELRQIGVRDEARMLGGLGPCGRPICCGAFLNDFQPVSIKMAKEQNLSLNPTKISGVCGRLMCCLKYEQDQYEQTRKRMPRVGREVVTPDGNGTVVDLNILKETVSVRIPNGDGTEIRSYPLEQISRPGAPAPAQEAAPAVNPPEEGSPAEMPEMPEMETTESAEVPAAPESAGEAPRAEAEPERTESRPETPRRRRNRPEKPRENGNAGGNPNSNPTPRFGPGAARKEGRPENGRNAGGDRPPRNRDNGKGKGAPKDRKLGQPVRRENPDRERENGAEVLPETGRTPEKRAPRNPARENRAVRKPEGSNPPAPAAENSQPAAKPKRASGWADAVEKALKAADS